MSKALEDIATERQRQIDKGWTPDHDDGHDAGEIALAAASYCVSGSTSGAPRQINVGASLVGRNLRNSAHAGWFHIAPLLWPWEAYSRKPIDRRSDLVRAGALIVAEIERLDREGKSDGRK